MTGQQLLTGKSRHFRQFFCLFVSFFVVSSHVKFITPLLPFRNFAAFLTKFFSNITRRAKKITNYLVVHKCLAWCQSCVNEGNCKQSRGQNGLKPRGAGEGGGKVWGLDLSYLRKIDWSILCRFLVFLVCCNIFRIVDVSIRIQVVHT